MRPTWIKRSSETRGKPPGTIIHVGEVHVVKPRVTCFVYAPEKLRQTQLDEDIGKFLSVNVRDDNPHTWLNVEGVNDVNIVKQIGRVFGIDTLTLEDIGDTGNRPKIEEFSNYVFIVIRSLSTDELTGRLFPEQISLILGSNFLLSFRERQTPLFEPIIQRLRLSNGRIRNSGVDYLAYSLMDLVVDNYFGTIEQVADKIESIEEVVTQGPSKSTLESIYRLKKDLLFLRKSVWPLREIGNRMINGDISFINESTKPYLRDVLDHSIHAVDTIETCRDIVTGLMDIYLSAISAKMNQVMKLLTIIGTIFLPLSFLAGWYGMNFKYMPELEWEYGYPAVILVALVTIISMLIVFKRRKWL
ncbi:MAG: magnesium/cobalt transporter CorA [Pseudomonadota bacterium]